MFGVVVRKIGIEYKFTESEVLHSRLILIMNYKADNYLGLNQHNTKYSNKNEQKNMVGNHTQQLVNLCYLWDLI